jgi:hypothetical protein
MAKKLLVIGASGVIGKRIFALAQESMPSVCVIKAHRKVLENNSTNRRIDIFSQKSLEENLTDIDVIINAVGPFYYDPKPILTVCLRLGCHYIDIAETTDFINKVKTIADKFPYNSFSNIITGCSTVPGLIEVFSKVWNQNNIAEIQAFLTMGSSNSVSNTLIYSLLRPLGQVSSKNTAYFSKLITKHFENIGYRTYGNYPSAFDLEGIAINNHLVPTNFYAGFDKEFYSYLLFLFAKILPFVPDNLLITLCKVANLFTPIIQRIGSPVGILSIEALDSYKNTLDKIQILAFKEGLNVPALPAVWAAKKLLEGSPSIYNKTLALSDLFTPQEITALLLQQGYKVYGKSINI